MNKFFTFIVNFKSKSQLDQVNIDIKLIFVSGILPRVANKIDHINHLNSADKKNRENTLDAT